MSGNEVADRSVRTLTSGPASGIMGAAALGRQLGIENVLAVDMGGTSFDAALVVGHEPTIRSIAHIEGVPLLMPVIELATIGAGGGSIAWIDAGGALEMGPHSAGAVPGPICYGRGGTEPTFTDAAVVSGLLDPEYFLGGEIKLDLSAVRERIAERIARPLGLSVDEAASGIVALTEAKMAAMLEEITISKGHDPRDFTLLTYGGGGPLTASALAARLKIPRVIVPSSSSTFSAWGMLTLDIVHDFSKTAVGSLQSLDERGALAGAFVELEARGVDALDREGVGATDRELHYSIDMRYENQEHTLNVAIAADARDTITSSRLRELFDERHKLVYGYVVTDPVEVVAYRVRAVGTLDKPRRPAVAAGSERSDHALKHARRATHRESGGEFEWRVYDRRLLLSGNVVDGPAIIEEPTTTTLVAPSQRLVVDEAGHLIISFVR
jgi:N-methylhydantoinase A